MNDLSEKVFNEACLLEPEQQQKFLDRVCSRNSEVRKEVESLLEADRRSDRLLDGQLEMIGMFNGPELGDIIFDRYRLIRQVGSGGMGKVFLAQQELPVERIVAVKVIQNGGLCSNEVLRRFASERQVLAMFNHPGLTKVLDGGVTENGLPFFVMEYVEGKQIVDFCIENRLLLRKRLELFVDVCKAIEHAHQKGVIHRDIKPSNILVAAGADRPNPKVIDFGIAKALGETNVIGGVTATRCGALLGTPLYMSPEQAKLDSQPLDVRVDVYSLGVLLFQLLTGSTPLAQHQVRHLGLLQILEMIRDSEAPLASIRAADAPGDFSDGFTTQKYTRLIRGELDWIVRTALANDPARRYDSVKTLRQDIENYLNGNPISVAAPSKFSVAKKLVRKHRFFVIVCVVLLAALVGWIQMCQVQKTLANEADLAIQLANKSQCLLEHVCASKRLDDLLARKESKESAEWKGVISRMRRVVKSDINSAAKQLSNSRVHWIFSRLGRSYELNELFDVEMDTVRLPFIDDRTVDQELITFRSRRDVCEQCQQMISNLIDAYEEEFRSDDVFVLDAKLQLAQLRLFVEDEKGAWAQLDEIMMLVRARGEYDVRCITMELLLAKCEQLRTGKVPHERVRKIMARIPRSNGDEEVQEVLSDARWFFESDCDPPVN